MNIILTIVERHNRFLSFSLDLLGRREVVEPCPPHDRRLERLGGAEELHQASAHTHGNAWNRIIAQPFSIHSNMLSILLTHDDALADALDGVLLPVVGGVEQVVGGLLERGQHQHGFLHLGQTMSGK